MFRSTWRLRNAVGMRPAGLAPPGDRNDSEITVVLDASKYRCPRLSIFVAAVAKGRRVRIFATAEIHFARLGCLKLNRVKVAALVGTIAEGLVSAFPAGAPEVGFARLDIDAERRVGSSGGITHSVFSCSLVNRVKFRQVIHVPPGC